MKMNELSIQYAYGRAWADDLIGTTVRMLMVVQLTVTEIGCRQCAGISHHLCLPAA